MEGKYISRTPPNQNHVCSKEEQWDGRYLAEHNLICNPLSRLLCLGEPSCDHSDSDWDRQRHYNGLQLGHVLPGAVPDKTYTPWSTDLLIFWGQAKMQWWVCSPEKDLGGETQHSRVLPKTKLPGNMRRWWQSSIIHDATAIDLEGLNTQLGWIPLIGPLQDC